MIVRKINIYIYIYDIDFCDYEKIEKESHLELLWR